MFDSSRARLFTFFDRASRFNLIIPLSLTLFLSLSPWLMLESDFFLSWHKKLVTGNKIKERGGERQSEGMHHLDLVVLIDGWKKSANKTCLNNISYNSNHQPQSFVILVVDNFRCREIFLDIYFFINFLLWHIYQPQWNDIGVHQIKTFHTH